MEENEREILEQHVETTDQSEQIQDGKQQTAPHAQLHENPEERDPTQHVVDLRIEHNDETLSEQVALTGLMADREEEKHNSKVSKQFDAFEDISKPNKGLELRVMCPLLLKLENQENDLQHSEKPEDLKQIQLSADIQQQSESTLVKVDTNQDETKNAPLWNM